RAAHPVGRLAGTHGGEHPATCGLELPDDTPDLKVLPMGSAVVRRPQSRCKRPSVVRVRKAQRAYRVGVVYVGEGCGRRCDGPECHATIDRMQDAGTTARAAA